MSPRKDMENHAIRTYSPERLRRHLDASGLSRRDLADELGVSRNHIFALLSGRRRINERMARAIAYTLDIEIIDLMEVDDGVPIEAPEDQGVSPGPRTDSAGVGQGGRDPSINAL